MACGEIAYFQKAHERGTQDWSAEGEPFVLAARLEQSVDSKQCVHYFADDYDRLFAGKGVVAPAGGVYHWTVTRKPTQVAGLPLNGGWADLVVEEFIPGGRISS